MPQELRETRTHPGNTAKMNQHPIPYQSPSSIPAYHNSAAHFIVSAPTHIVAHGQPQSAVILGEFDLLILYDADSPFIVSY